MLPSRFISICVHVPLTRYHLKDVKNLKDELLVEYLESDEEISMENDFVQEDLESPNYKLVHEFGELSSKLAQNYINLENFYISYT